VEKRVERTQESAGGRNGEVGVARQVWFDRTETAKIKENDIAA
jgi:hypothetical protein